MAVVAVAMPAGHDLADVQAPASYVSSPMPRLRTTHTPVDL